MAGGYTVGIASETKAFKQGIESGVIDPLEDAEKSLLELGDNRGPEELERSLKDAEKATDRLKDETKRTADAIEDDFKSAYRKVKQSSDDGMRSAEDSMGDFKQEANQTARESAASFDGSAESIVDAFQEVAANAFGGFGVAGEVAGLAAALGIGAAVAGFTKVNEAEEESRERAAEWADAYIEAGGRILSATQVVEKGREILQDQSEELEENAKDWGVTESIALLAMAGDTNALIEVRESLVEKEGEVKEAVEASESGLRGLNREQRTMREEASAGRETLDKLAGEMDQGATLSNIYSESLKLLATHTEGATTKTDKFGDTVTTLPDGKVIYIDAETGQATDDTEAIEKKIYGIQDKNVRVGVYADTSQFDRAVRRINGTTLRVGARVVTSGQGWD